jgi:manganese/iron transport system substrate-binding protein
MVMAKLNGKTGVCSFLGLLLSMVGGCQAPAPTTGSDARPQVVATSTILADLATEVAGDEAVVTSLLNPGDDPHVYEPVPKDTVALEQADLILYNGYNLEPGLIRLIQGSQRREQAFAVGEVVAPLSFQYQGQTRPDPHVWGDVENAIAITTAIRDRLIELDPDSAAMYEQNATELISELKQLDLWIGQQIQTIAPEQRKLVTTHDAFQYYAKAYGLEVLGTLIGISTEEQPSAQTLQALVEAIKAAQVPAIFAETTINPQLMQTVAQEAGVRLAEQQLYSDSIGAAGSAGESYIKMMQANTTSIVEALEGQITPLEITE